MGSVAARIREPNGDVFADNAIPIDLFRGACAVKGNVQVAAHVKRIDNGAAYIAHHFEVARGQCSSPLPSEEWPERQAYRFVT